MKTTKLYYENSYLQEFSATVMACEPKGEHFEVVLSETAFYPEGGGQPSDKGTMDLAKVLSVKEREGVIFHTTDREVEVGRQLFCQVDFPLRYDHMQQHTGEHILSGLILSEYGYENVGFHLGAEAVTIDLSGEIPEWDLERLENLANEIILKNVAVSVEFPTEEMLGKLQYRSKKLLTGEVRIVKVAGCDTCACCGTHLGSSGEAQLLKILAAQRYKGGTRLTFLCGGRALRDYQQKDRQCKQIAQLLSVKPLEAYEAAQKLQTEAEGLRQGMHRLQGQVLDVYVASVPVQAVHTVFEEGLGGDAMRSFALKLAEKSTRYACVFSLGAKGYSYAIATKSEDAGAFAKALCQQFSGRGGGSKELAQGNVSGAQVDIAAWLQEELQCGT